MSWKNGIKKNEVKALEDRIADLEDEVQMLKKQMQDWVGRQQKLQKEPNRAADWHLDNMGE